ncbi:MAG: hypothetical protein K2Z81_25785 [Cyanobacteria bacterium]|nr:hypothetical protein [Cyanobacteriota bacterium]
MNCLTCVTPLMVKVRVMAARILALLEHAKHGEQLTDCLEQSGYEVEIVSSFRKAITALNERTFDMIISDVHLENGGSVFDFLKWVKSRQTLQAVPFVLLNLEPSPIARYVEDGVRTAARLMGAAKYISIDEFECSRLREEINKLLSGLTKG